MADQTKTTRLTEDEHRLRHLALHRALDELLADWLSNTESLPSVASVSDLMDWSHGQRIEPTGTSTGNFPIVRIKFPEQEERLYIGLRIANAPKPKEPEPPEYIHGLDLPPLTTTWAGTTRQMLTCGSVEKAEAILHRFCSARFGRQPPPA